MAITIGILAHVDAGKTTLSEQMLLLGGAIRKAGRVDHGDSFLDNNEMERNRGITIYSKEARLDLCGSEVILLDTPGHVDFSAEMERSLSVMDFCILLISAPDGVTAYTRTLWELLKIHGIPVFIFVNKMDRYELKDGNASDDETVKYDPEVKEGLLMELTKKLSPDIVDFSRPENERGREFAESLAMLDEGLLELFLEADEGGNEDKSETNKKLYTDIINAKDKITHLIYERKLFPCFFGSALKCQCIKQFIEEMTGYLSSPRFPEDFGARIYKISHDDQGQRLLHVRITGGSLCVRDEVTLKRYENMAGSSKAGQDSDQGSDLSGVITEKITQIRIYSGPSFKTVQSVEAGQTCVLCGLTGGAAGDGMGYEQTESTFRMQPVLSFRVRGPEGVHITTLYEKLHIIEEESPELSLSYDEDRGDIYAQLMGQVQSEILKSEMERRFGMKIELDEGEVVYRETIAGKVEGVGHFEPLRHYAEVHLILEPGKRGSGLVFAEKLSSDLLATNWKRLILQHLSEKQHRGVLTGSPITDMKITLVAGRAHPKHTEGGDFRQATYRAVRQGLMQAESILLEPWYDLQITVPSANVGRVLTDLEKYHGSGEVVSIGSDTAVINGRAPVATIRNYAGELAGFTASQGKADMRFAGFDVCHNTEEVIQKRGYDPERDTRNRADSVFCSHGAGYTVPWDEVFLHMHLPAVLKNGSFTGYDEESMIENAMRREASKGKAAGEDELKAIFEQTYKTSWHGRRDISGEDTQVNGRRVQSFGRTDNKNGESSSWKSEAKRKPEPYREPLLLVDGYNVIHADEELSRLSADNFDAARGKLLDILSDFQGAREGRLIVVFDAYKVKDGREHEEKYHNIEVVYTKQAQTADMYIEKTVGLLGGKYKITVATSDGLEQVIARGRGALLISSRELLRLIKEQREGLVKDYVVPSAGGINPVRIPDMD